MSSTRILYVRKRRRQAGVGLVTAIFLLVVLAGLGVAMVGLFNAQQTSSNLDLQGARAYQAARAGLEWGLFQQMRNNSCSADARSSSRWIGIWLSSAMGLWSSSRQSAGSSSRNRLTVSWSQLHHMFCASASSR